MPVSTLTIGNEASIDRCSQARADAGGMGALENIALADCRIDDVGELNGSIQVCQEGKALPGVRARQSLIERNAVLPRGLEGQRRQRLLMAGEAGLFRMPGL